MKNSKLLLTSLLAAATMSASAYGATGDTILVNFGYSQTGTASGSGVTGVTGTWNEFAAFSGSASDLDLAAGGTATGSSIAWTASGNWSYTSNVTDNTLKGYLDDNASTQPVINVDTTFLVCDVTIYCATDSGNASFAAKNVNGTNYTYSNGAAIVGDASWGSSQTATAVEGTNALTVSNLDGVLTIKGGTYVNSDGTVVRGTIAGLKIVNAYTGTAHAATLGASAAWSGVSFNTAWTNSQSTVDDSGNITTTNGAYADFTLTADAVLTLDSAVVTDAIYVSGEGKTLTLTNSESGSLTLSGPATLRANAGATLALNAADVSLGTGVSGVRLAGAGTFNFKDAVDSEAYGKFSNLASFSGTVKFDGAVNLGENAIVVSAGPREFANGASGSGLAVSSGATATISGGASSFTGGISSTQISGIAGSDNSVLVSGSGSVLNITGGTLTLTQSIGTHAGGVINQSGGTVNTTALRLHDSGGASGTSTYNLSGGVLNISSRDTTGGNTSGVLIGHWGLGKGLLSVTGGVLNAANTIACVSYTSPGEMSISGGEVNLKGISLAGQSGGSDTATVTLSGNGRLNIGSSGLATGNSTAHKSFHLNGGTLGALDNWSTGADVTLNVGGAVEIDTMKRVVSATGASSAMSGDSVGAIITFGDVVGSSEGKLTVSGAGTLALTGAVDLFNAIEVESGASVTTTSGVSFALANLTGTDNGDGSTTFTLFTLADGASLSWAEGIGVSNVNLAGTSIAGRGLTANFSTSGTVTLSGGVAGDLVWNGSTDSSTWNYSATNENWKIGDAAASFQYKDNVTFGADATFKTVTLENGADITVGNATVEGSDPYTFAPTSGTAKISGSKLTVESGATLTVGNSKSSTVNLAFDDIAVAGTLQFNNGNSTWSSLTFSEGGKLVISDGVDRVNNLTISKVAVNGAAEITAGADKQMTIEALSGASSLMLRGSSGWGALTVNINSLEDYSGTISLVKNTYSVEAVVSAAKLGTTANIVVGADTTLAASASSAGTYDFTKVTGTGKLIFAGPTGNSGYNGGLKISLSDSFTGDFVLNSGVWLSFAADHSTFGGATIVLSGGALFHSKKTVNLTNDIRFDGEAAIWTDDESATVTLSGDVTGSSGTLNRRGAGAMIFSKSVSVGTFNQENGATRVTGTADLTTLTVSGGSLEFSGSSTEIGTLNLNGGTLKVTNGTVLDLTSNSARAGTSEGSGATLEIDGAGSTVKISNGAWNAGSSLGMNYTNTLVKLSNGGVFEVMLAQSADDAANGAAKRGFSITGGEGTYRYSGTGTSYIADNSSAANNQHIGLANTATLIFDVTDSGATLEVSKVIATADAGASTSTTGALKKIGDGTLTLTNANLYSGGTRIEGGVLVAANVSALGTNSVRVAGGQLKVSGVTLNQTAITVVLGAAYKANGGVAALVGESGSLAAGTTVTVDATDLNALGLVAGVANEYSIWDSTLTTDATLALSDAFKSLLATEGWEYTVSGGVLTISSIPEPSVFGLLAGLGALALAGTRRRRKKA